MDKWNNDRIARDDIFVIFNQIALFMKPITYT